MFVRRYRTPTVWREMERLQREMNRLYDAFSPRRYRTAPGYPAMNVWMAEDKLVVTSEVPGVAPKDIDVSVVNDTLTLSGERAPDAVEAGAQYHRSERGSGKFSRSLQLPYGVDANKVEATFKNGLLRIILPRKEEDKPRKIKVKS
ncbi:MAG: Hsp20/alpha crystallin family protein [Anaerolineales bacterium]|nr:Hsp20/alpha crystallin family protein [Anaerolineales bacterium]